MAQTVSGTAYTSKLLEYTNIYLMLPMDVCGNMAQFLEDMK